MLIYLIIYFIYLIYLWKQWCILFYRILCWKKNIYLRFCNIINVVTATFDRFNASLLSKSINSSFIYFYLNTSCLNFWIVCFMVSMEILCSTTVFNTDNNQKYFLSSKSAYYYDFWRSCDTEDWSNDAENSALITEINYSLYILQYKAMQ